MFKNAWDLGRISGIKIRMHWSFLILPAIVYFSTLLDGNGILTAVISVAFVLAIFVCVLLHELGHAFAARGFSIGTRDIILLPIGGVASLESIPEKPLQELWIAVAGPLVNVVIAIVLYCALAYRLIPEFAIGFVDRLALVNLLLVAFNMIPAFPMDGGRVLRSILAMFLSYVQATRIAATVGKYCAIALGIYGLATGNFMLVLLAMFVFFAGQAEKMSVVQRHQMRQVDSYFPNAGFQQQAPAASAPPRSSNEINVPATLSADSVMAWLGNVKAECCNVVDSGRIIGSITRAQLMSLVSQGFGPMPIGQAMKRNR